MSEKKHVIWSNENLDIEDGWREAYVEFLEINKLHRDTNDENAIYDFMVETNNEYLGDEKMNLDIQLSQSILVIADIGRWNGRSDGYAVIESGNIKDCLYTECDYATWYVDGEGDFRCDAVHHDGRNHYLYRVFKDDVSDEQIEDLKDKIYEGNATREDIELVTDRLGNEIGRVYGWEFPPVGVGKEPLVSKIKSAEKHRLVQMPGTEGNFGEKHWGNR